MGKIDKEKGKDREKNEEKGTKILIENKSESLRKRKRSKEELNRKGQRSGKRRKRKKCEGSGKRRGGEWTFHSPLHTESWTRRQQYPTDWALGSLVKFLQLWLSRCIYIWSCQHCGHQHFVIPVWLENHF
jgi:hypothetical protein